MMTYTGFGVTVLRRKLEQSAFLELRGGAVVVPVTARAQLSATQVVPVRLSNKAAPKTPLIVRNRGRINESNNILGSCSDDYKPTERLRAYHKRRNTLEMLTFLWTMESPVILN